MAELLRDTALGAIVRYATGNRAFQYPEERPGFQIPEVWQQVLDSEDSDADDSTVLGRDADEDIPVEKRSMMDRRSPSFESATVAQDEEAGFSDKEGSEKADEIETIPDPSPYPLGRISTAGTGPATNNNMDHTHRAHVPSGLALERSRSRTETMAYTQDRLAADEEHDQERAAHVHKAVVPRRLRMTTSKDGSGPEQTVLVVDWYSSDDTANPTNWSNRRRLGVLLLICVYTFVVYTSSAIYTVSEEGVMASFGVDATHSALGLALFVLGYGVGPLLFSPLSEVAAIGRNPVYAVTMALFVVVSLPTALAYGNHDTQNIHGHATSSGSYAGLMVLRFLQGFFGSPCLASGAATLGDMYSLLNLPFALVGWVSAAYCGPALGPLLSGFSVPAKGWRWSLLEILWASAPVCLAMLVLLPETSAATILLRRAQRLRRVTGSDRFRAPSELSVAQGGTAASSNFAAVIVDALLKPLEITLKDPAILFVQVYSAIIYGIYYSFFEAFPLVYPAKYGMSYGQVGLVFLCILVADLIGVVIYCSYLAFYLNPRIRATGRFPPNESRLIPALIAAFGPTAGLFIFAWTANGAPHVPWIAPTIGITIYGAAAFVVMQCIFVYVPLSYPQYAASLFAANDFFRSALACGAVLFGRPLYMNLGVPRGTSLLGGLSTIGIIGIWLLYIYGARLRAMSKFATKD